MDPSLPLGISEKRESKKPGGFDCYRNRPAFVAR